MTLPLLVGDNVKLSSCPLHLLQHFFVMSRWFFTLTNLAIDIINIFLFVRERYRKAAELRRAGLSTHEANANMLSALTHVAIDTMRTLSVFIALIANKFFGLTAAQADAYSSIAIGEQTLPTPNSPPPPPPAVFSLPWTRMCIS
jgi:hypothetical protein